MELQWPLILFTFFNCLTGGIFAMQGLLTLLGRGKQMQMVSLAAALISLAIGGISVFLHLEHWERIFNAFGALLGGNGTAVSGITLELWGCVVLGVVLVLYFLFMRRSEDGVAPKWCAVLAIVVGVALPFVTGDSYLMESLPMWDTPLLPLYYVANTLLLGGLAALIIGAATKADDARDVCIKVSLVGALATGVIAIVYAIYISLVGGSFTDVTYYFDPTLPDVSMIDTGAYTGAILYGSLAVAFWLVVVVIGCCAPALFAVMNMADTAKLGPLKGIAAKVNADADKQRLTWAVAALVCAVVGSFMWRCLLYLVAIHALPFY